MTAEPQAKPAPTSDSRQAPLRGWIEANPLGSRPIKAPLKRSSKSPGRTRLCRLPSAKAREEAKEIAIRVDDDELPIARFFVALSVPALLKRDIDRGASP